MKSALVSSWVAGLVLCVGLVIATASQVTFLGTQSKAGAHTLASKAAHSKKHREPEAGPEAEESGEEDEEDDEKTDVKKPEEAAAPPGAPEKKDEPQAPPGVAPKSTADEKGEEAEDDDDEEEPKGPGAPAPSAPVVGEQVPVVAVVTIKNVEYDLLAKDQSLHAQVEAAVRDAIAEGAGDDISSDDVSLVSWPGSVRARAVIKPIDGVSSATVVSELQTASDMLSTSIVEKVSAIDGITSAAKGPLITCDVDVLVANVQSSVSKVMSRAKGQKHLNRVYELEKKAAAARRKIGYVAGQEMKIDERITDLENEDAFNAMVDQRVVQVKKELAAPVFASTIGDMWKELRKFGTPCYLKHLKTEKSQMKARIAEAEGNATEVEKELQDARDDVHESWYGKPKSGAAHHGHVWALIAVTVAVLGFQA